MDAIHSFVARSADSHMDSTIANLLITLLVLGFAAILLIGGLIALRRIRRQRKRVDTLPLYEGKAGNHHRLTIHTNGKRSTSIYVRQEKQQLLDDSSSPPPSPIPEIRITFPEEVDESGKRQSGRVVVVRVGEHGVGLEPLKEDLPSYQQSDADRFHSLDLDRIGGLKEKEQRFS
ncbi:hypothetical protein M501DRAFT_1010491 [Patellaria atrata CBS 101060]|uniref:Uncharacterized protein n=1 Tax=Patellaria atrata CBS 101060 TaxID=1346257 RepID=A0A9P4SEY1_9PEZI|nr:hypothetical protein M501DRAFT_1010491 [Patellaria atrata CBS 101060]